MNEVAVIMPTSNNDLDVDLKRDVIVQEKCGSLNRICESHALYDPLHYVLFHPRGAFGYDKHIPKKDSRLQRTFSFFFLIFLSFT